MEQKPKAQKQKPKAKSQKAKAKKQKPTYGRIAISRAQNRQSKLN